MNARKKSRKKTSRPKVLGWKTTDEDEIARRQRRAEKEALTIKSADGSNAIFSDWLVSGESGIPYPVEIRSLTQPINSCACKDFLVNGLGTCKHIEAVSNKLRKRKRAERDAGSVRVEIYLDRRDMSIKISYPKRMRSNTRARVVTEGFFDQAGNLRGDPLQTMAVLKDRLLHETSRVRGQIRISPHLDSWVSQLQQAADQRAVQRRFEQDLKTGHASLDVVRLPLFPYQQEGMMHLAFTGRALLADEMGLGKTVQAIAASELLARLHGIEKVLVISPASLKSEWLEQINKFSHRQALIIQGMRKRRYKLYQQPAFYYLANYEQFFYDKDFINENFKPDLIILDEAQRIKNWQTKTASAIKQLKSPYAFILTGTPLENRIDEIYSLAQFLDPTIFGPLFRFNRDFHQLDEKGQAIGYKNLDQLHERLRPVMLRRRKEDVEGELPERSINNYFVPLSEAQKDQYKEHEEIVARLAHLAQKRPLKKEERERLMIALGCMRMACDTAYILDQVTKVSPKLDELEKLLEDLLTDPECKIIIFSEWERMLFLLSERLIKKGIDYAWHTGSVTQNRRREEINRFKTAPNCRIFLATDSAATGLNLQIARVVVNLDLPWNPAKLEQRIARAWRKHQKNPVTVINLVSEMTIEHRMLSVLRHKTDLADEVVDGAGKVTDMEISVGKGSFMDTLDELLTESEQKKAPLEQLAEDAIAIHPETVEHLEQRGNVVLAIVEKEDTALRDDMSQRVKKHYGETPPQLEMLDRTTYEALQKLVEAGVIQFTQPTATAGSAGPSKADKEKIEQRKREAKISKFLNAADEKQRMSQLLADGDFINEALAPISEALDLALAATATLANIKIDEPIAIAQIGLLQQTCKLPAKTVSIIAILRHERDGLNESAARETLESAQEIINAIKLSS